MKAIFATEDKELGWVGFQTAEEAGEGAIQINCYENLAEFDDAKLDKVRQSALAKLTDTEKAALGLTEFKVSDPTSNFLCHPTFFPLLRLTEFKVAGPCSTPPAAGNTTSKGQAVP
jgi:hypothetical protein